MFFSYVTVVKEPYELSDDNGKAVLATIETYGDTTHTFVERKDFKGHFLPGFRPITAQDPINQLLGSADLEVREADSFW